MSLAALFMLVPALHIAAGPLPGDAGNQPIGEKAAKKPAGPNQGPSTVEVRFADDSTMKLILLDERFELSTPYGKLLIPVADIGRIEFAWRLADEDAKRIEGAVAELGSADFKRRQGATAELQALGVKAYPALLQATKQADAEVVRRAEDLLEKLRQTVPAERLEVRSHDLVHTEHSKIAGRLTAVTLKVKTFQFGEQQLKLADVRGLRSPAAVEAEPVDKTVMVESGGRWWPAEVLKREGDKYYIHYTGWDNSYDEYVTKDRIRFSADMAVPRGKK